MLHASDVKALTRPELKFVARCVLEALDVLHQDGVVHTGNFLSQREIKETLLIITRQTSSLAMSWSIMEVILVFVLKASRWPTLEVQSGETPSTR